MKFPGRIALEDRIWVRLAAWGTGARDPGAPRNTRRVTAFAIANFGHEPFVGNLKFFDRFDGFYRTGRYQPPPKDGVARRFTLRRALAVSDRDGRALYDPLAELPLGSAVEVAPGKSLPVFAELDTHGLAPGRREATLVLRSATAGFPDARIAVEVTVTDDDLDFWNPLPSFISGNSAAFRQAMRDCAMLFDILELYRPATTPEVVALVRELGVKEVWGYHISGKYTGADAYRNAVWRHLRDGFRETMAYWHLDESAAFDARPQHPYGTCYVDWDADELMLSRRQLAADMAAEEGRLVNYLRQKAKDDPAKRARIDALVKAAADDGRMAAMDAALEQLLELL